MDEEGNGAFVSQKEDGDAVRGSRKNTGLGGWFGFENRPSHTWAVWLWPSYFLSKLPELHPFLCKMGLIIPTS